MICPKNEVKIVAKVVKAIMEDVKDIMPWVPMISDLEIAYENWRDKVDYIDD